MATFAEETLAGLRATPKTLSSKWFYNQRGNQLFQEIMTTPEYYLTDCEREIYQRHAPDLLAAMNGEPFDLIELGAGDGSKTQFLIEHFWRAEADFVYRPIDISKHALRILGEVVARQWPLLPFKPVQDDYFTALDRLASGALSRRRLVLFPGANVGNFSTEEAIGFLKRVGQFMDSGDLLLTGFDLKKDPATILAAYDDAQGRTAAFNLNLLARINEELGGNFDLDYWDHWETYDPATGAALSYLVAERAQTVHLANHEETFHFQPYETISVEISQKYSRQEIHDLAAAAGFEVIQDFEDSKGWFVDSLWRQR